MEPRVTLEVRTSCRTWLGLGVAVRVRSAWRRAPPAKRVYYMPLLLPHLSERRLHLGHHHHDLLHEVAVAALVENCLRRRRRLVILVDERRGHGLFALRRPHAR